MKKLITLISSLAVLALLIWAGNFYWRHLRGAGPAVKSPPQISATLFTKCSALSGPPAEDFISGWLTPEGALGRPVDILIKDDEMILISDDKAWVVYRVVYDKMAEK
jgi:hypothetical protein